MVWLRDIAAVVASIRDKARMATRTASRLRRFTIVGAISGLVLATLGRGRAYAETHDHSQTSSSTQSATYYVSPNGNDSAAGTLASPWRTIQKAASTLQPGQTAIGAAGTYERRGWRQKVPG